MTKLMNCCRRQRNDSVLIIISEQKNQNHQDSENAYFKSNFQVVVSSDCVVYTTIYMIKNQAAYVVPLLTLLILNDIIYSYIKISGDAKMENIKWIFFDMGYTLVNEDDAHNVRIDAGIRELAEQGITITREQVWEEAYQLGKTVKSPIPKALRSLGVKHIKDYVAEDGETAFEDARATLMSLKKKYKIGIIANQPIGSAQRLERYGLLDCVDAIFESDALGLFKPDPAFYTYALNSVGCAADQAVMVGDRPDNDIVPAAKVGMKTVRIIRGFFKWADDIHTPDFTINSLEQLKDIFLPKN